MEYKILEENMERLEKKLNKIAAKCKKYGNKFVYEKVGEEYAEYTDEDGSKYTVKYIIVNVEGRAVINNWKFIASVQHTEKGNIIKKCCDIEVPERYYTSEPVCEHCNSKRSRKDTYIVQNTETGEFKQVGKSCLKDFTCGMSAEGVACYISLFDTLIKGEHIEGGFHPTAYIETAEAMRYIAETIRCFGYVSSTADRATKQRAREYYETDHGMMGGIFANRAKKLQNEMRRVSFDANSDDTRELVNNILVWISKQPESNNYFHNLKTVCSLEYIMFDNFGLLASVFPAYDRNLEYEEQKLREQEAGKISEHVGNIGDRITVQIKDFAIVTSWETQYGLTKIYKIVDTNDNVYIWKTSGGLADDAIEIVGTVKSHNEYRGVKQTELTRVRTTRKADKENKADVNVRENSLDDEFNILSLFEE